MAWTDRGNLAARDSVSRALPGTIDEFLVSGGDGRLALSQTLENAYGCTPFPAPGLIDFASSTASSISPQGYARARIAREELLTASLRAGPDQACEAAVMAARMALLNRLDLEGSGAEVVFSASGTDAQLQTLFLVRLLHPGSLATVIAGADQTGSGTAHTARGRHFSQTTSTGATVEKGQVIAGLDGIESFEVGFRDAEGGFRAPAEMDDAVLAAVKQALAGHDHVLLQAMEASKFGWKAPGDALLDEIAARFPGRVQIVADACQLRISRLRLEELLSKGMLVLVTGSKFFTGPAFSGALLVPRGVAAKIATASVPAGQLAGYATRFDWPARWTSLRNRFSHHFNFGQWLRWEAALEEMRLYYAVPRDFRQHIAQVFCEEMQGFVGATPHLAFLEGGAEFVPAQPTIFPLRLIQDDESLSAQACADIYRAMRRDLSARAGSAQQGDLLRMACQAGQPVALAHGNAALRFSLSARIVRDCWSPDPACALRNIAALRDDLSIAIGKLDLLVRLYPDLQEASA
ncbi:MAG TPA: hypothetical protein VHX18_03925 [Rhizomicrobium sp.]|jgi:hypothetical protein|nr:hypothetical protein [Rhizomicrobium sp.]